MTNFSSNTKSISVDSVLKKLGYKNFDYWKIELFPTINDFPKSFRIDGITRDKKLINELNKEFPTYHFSFGSTNSSGITGLEWTEILYMNFPDFTDLKSKLENLTKSIDSLTVSEKIILERLLNELT